MEMRAEVKISGVETWCVRSREYTLGLHSWELLLLLASELFLLLREAPILLSPQYSHRGTWYGFPPSSASPLLHQSLHTFTQDRSLPLLRTHWFPQDPYPLLFPGWFPQDPYPLLFPGWCRLVYTKLVSLISIPWFKLSGHGKSFVYHN